MEMMDLNDFNTVFRRELNRIKELPIVGCITGSCMLDDDFSTWQDKPDIDIFVYTDTQMVWAISEILSLGYTFGGKGKKKRGEEIKFDWLLDMNSNKSLGLSTIMLEHRIGTHDISVNITVKKGCTNVAEVLCSYDMSIIMKGYDIKNKMTLDLRTQNGWQERVASPNLLSNNIEEHPSRFTLARALRQWDRVTKYYNRGYDTRPMAQYYLDKINEVLAAGAVFGTERDEESFEEYAKDFKEIREIIKNWLEVHEDD